MKIAVTADIHLNPGDEADFDLSGYDKWIDCGDLLNIIPEGMDVWRTGMGRLTAHSIAQVSKDITLIWKNHGGRREWVEELFIEYPHVKVVDDCNIFTDERIYMFKHGSEYTDWKLWSVGADDVTAFVTRIPYLRDLWYKFCRARGWMPSAYKGQKRSLVNKILMRNPNKYEKLVGGMWAMSLAEAHDKSLPVTMFIGHSHTYAEIATGFDCKVINLENKQLMEVEI